MDKKDAIGLSIHYLNKLKSLNIGFSEVWLFGSYATGSQNENSDIDIAIVLDDSVAHSFDTEIQLMIIRKGEETMIEPHVISKEDFYNCTPIAQQIIDNGIRIQ
ncbi:MAG TPA: nucleotidyltransferase [Bacteroidales bacterium]|nr:nucleotidyltransferase [Bacteroidales bacterium]